MTICFAGIILTPEKAILASFSFAAALLILLALKKFRLSNKLKISLLYSHIVFLLFPLVMFTAQTACGMLCISSCYNGTNSFVNLLILSLPTTFLISTIVGFVIIPLYYVKVNSEREIKRGWIPNFVKRSSHHLKIKSPKVFAVDKAKPLAFSFKHFKSAIFMSVGMFDILNRKELEAVILHELAHIREKTSALKLSLAFFRLFSPMSILVKFHHEKTAEERKADRVAISVQKTGRHIKSAREKIKRYESYG